MSGINAHNQQDTEEQNAPQLSSEVPADSIPSRLDENEIAELRESIREAQYFDASSMAPLNAKSLAAIARLRAYQPPPFSIWDRLPLSRKAAVLVLLFADRKGDLRVVVTMRAATLRSFSGHAAFPGGKADTLTETPFQIARREAWEEIGLAHDDSKIPAPFRIEHLCELPFSFARTALAVRPCVAFLHSNELGAGGSSSLTVEDSNSMIPRLDAKEVAAVFSAPFHNFLGCEDEPQEGVIVPGKPSDWYDGRWIDWHEGQWRLHNFYVPITNQRVSKPAATASGEHNAKMAERLDAEEDEGLTRYKVWGMTARMMVDAARIAYDEEPAFEHNTHFGDESMIETLFKMGRLKEKIPGGPDLSDADIQAAARMANPNDINPKI